MEMMKNKVNNLIDLNEREKTLKYIDRYTKNVRETFSVMKSILTSQFDEIMDIQILGNTANFYPLLIKTYRLDGTDTKSQFRKVCRIIEIFSFRVYGIEGGMANKGQSRLYTLAKEFNGNFEKLYNDLKLAIRDFSSDKDFMTNLGDGDFFTYYSSTVKNYFFWKYENYLRDAEQPVAAPIPYSIFKTQNKRYKFSIEHILPQNPKEETLKVITDKLKHDRISASFVETYLHSIGNLTIDPVSANSSKGNSDIKIKNTVYFKKAPFKTQNELEGFLDNGKWTHQSISKRKEKLLEFAQLRWGNYAEI